MGSRCWLFFGILFIILIYSLLAEKSISADPPEPLINNGTDPVHN